MTKLFSVVFIAFALSACGPGLGQEENRPGPNPVLPPVGVTEDDGAVVHGRAMVEVSSNQATILVRLWDMLITQARAATGTTTVTYNNVASTNFSIDVASLGAAGFSGDTLSLGSVSLASLDDNHLKVCNPGGNTKCTKAAIRVYTTGSVAGFVHTVDLYGVDVFAGALNPNTPVGLNAGGSVEVQTYTIPNSKKRLKMIEFPSPTYSISSDFSNGGSGDYSMTLVVEYILLP
jgi:hypothetical protein